MPLGGNGSRGPRFHASAAVVLKNGPPHIKRVGRPHHSDDTPTGQDMAPVWRCGLSADMAYRQLPIRHVPAAWHIGAAPERCDNTNNDGRRFSGESRTMTCLDEYVRCIEASPSEATRLTRFAMFFFNGLELDLETEKRVIITTNGKTTTGRMDLACGTLVMEFKTSIMGRKLADAESQLRRYVSGLLNAEKRNYILVATDGIRFNVYGYQIADGAPLPARRRHADPQDLRGSEAEDDRRRPVYRRGGDFRDTRARDAGGVAPNSRWELPSILPARLRPARAALWHAVWHRRDGARGAARPVKTLARAALARVRGQNACGRMRAGRRNTAKAALPRPFCNALAAPDGDRSRTVRGRPRTPRSSLNGTNSVSSIMCTTPANELHGYNPVAVRTHCPARVHDWSSNRGRCVRGGVFRMEVPKGCQSLRNGRPPRFGQRSRGRVRPHRHHSLNRARCGAGTTHARTGCGRPTRSAWRRYSTNQGI